MLHPITSDSSKITSQAERSLKTAVEICEDSVKAICMSQDASELFSLRRFFTLCTLLFYEIDFI